VNQLPSRTFAQSFALKPDTFAWLLGAGASASAGIPTGYQMILDFRAMLNARLAQEGAPPQGDPSEYSLLFETLYPDAAERRQYIDLQVKKGEPSAGHRVLGSLLASRKTPCVFTTNFDQLIERATVLASECLPLKGRGHATVAAIDNPERAERCVRESDWPLIAKLHGDFQSTALKNTSVELVSQDERMRKALRALCYRFGLIVVGYSGRDESVMDALEACLELPGAFPTGLFWVTSDATTLLPSVNRLMENAQRAGVKTAIVKSDDFDRFALDMAASVELPERLQDHIAQRPHKEPSWLQRHAWQLGGAVGSVVLAAAGIAFSMHQGTVQRKDKFDGLYTSSLSPKQGEYETDLRKMVELREVILDRIAKDERTSLPQDLAIAEQWLVVASAAIDVWRPLADCVGVADCIPGESGPVVCKRVTRLFEAVNATTTSLRSMGQLQALGMGGERPKEPDAGHLNVLLTKGCSAQHASNAAAKEATAQDRQRRLDRAKGDWAKIEQSRDPIELRRYAARYGDLTSVVPGSEAFTKLAAQLVQDVFESRKQTLADALCALSSGNSSALDRIREVAHPKPRRCDRDEKYSSCDWDDFYAGIRGNRFGTSNERLNGIFSEMLTRCSQGVVVETKVESIEGRNDPICGSFCTLTKTDYLMDGETRFLTETCGSWSLIQVKSRH